MILGRWAARRHPEALLWRCLAATHAHHAAEWRSAHDNFLVPPPPGSAYVPYERSGFRPTGDLAIASRDDATDRRWEYRNGSGHRWLGPADSDRSPAQIRADFLALCLEKAAYHDRMAARWARAVPFPWVGIAPDPPEPPLIYDPQGDSW